MSRKKVAIFSDSLLQDIGKIESEIFDFNVLAFPGLMAEQVVNAETHEYYHVDNVCETLMSTDSDTLVICLGTNDIGHFEPGDKVANQVLAIGKQISASAPDINRIIYCLLPERNNQRRLFNDTIQASGAETIVALDWMTGEMFESDRLHINDLGLKIFIEHLTSVLSENPNSNECLNDNNQQDEF